jgi:hypothetical protein
MYSQKTLNGYYFKTSGFYFFFIPVAVPYKKVYSMAESAGLKLKEKFGPNLESGKMFGFGWIGVEIEKPTENRADVVQVKCDYEIYEYKGVYKTLGRAYKKLMKEKPGKNEYLNLFLDDPEKIKPDDCRTIILFR